MFEIHTQRLPDKFGAGARFFFPHFLELADQRRREGDSHRFGGSHGLDVSFLWVLLSKTCSYVTP